MDCKIVYLEPIGSGTLKSELRSDALWGAICWAIRWLNNEQILTEFIHAYAEDSTKACLISSAFPYSESFDPQSQTWRKTHFFPIPVLPPDPAQRIESEGKSPHEIKLEHRKQVKKKDKNAFISQAGFENILTGRKSSSQGGAVPEIAYRPMTHNTINRIYGGTLNVIDGANWKPNMEEDEIPKLGQLYHTDDIFLKNLTNERSGWFFLLQGDTKSYIEPALRFLEHYGIGGDRSIGKGRFRIYCPEEAFVIKTPADANALLTLSLYHPLPTELLEMQQLAGHNNFNYVLEERRGRMIWQKDGNGKLQRLDTATLFFKEGSVFPPVQSTRKIFGQNIIVGSHSTGFDIRRYGHAFMVPLKIN